MDNRKKSKTDHEDDLRGFEDFIESIPTDQKSQNAGNKKNDNGFEHFTFLSNDGTRLEKLKVLFNEKLPFSSKFDQSKKLITDQLEEISILKERLYSTSDRSGSPYRKSISEIFNSYFDKK
jgi:hypothetical protein